MQAELARKYELLAQLEEKYGEDAPSTGWDTTIKAITHGWQAAGNLQVDVLEAQALAVTRPASILSMRSVKTNVKAFVTGQRAQGVTKSTAWRTGQAPVWNEKLAFERCSHDDIVVLQARYELLQSQWLQSSWLNGMSNLLFAMHCSASVSLVPLMLSTHATMAALPKQRRLVVIPRAIVTLLGRGHWAAVK